MKDIEEIKTIISTYFCNNNMLSQRLPQVYILYKALQKIGEEPTLVMGHLVNHTLSLYYIHFWVENKNQQHDIVSETYNKLVYTLSPYVVLIKQLPVIVLETYLNMDCITIEKKREKSFNACLAGLFLEDLQLTTTPLIYSKISKLYNRLTVI